MPLRAAFALILLLAAGPSLGIPPAPAYRVPRAADGHPDFQGNWTNVTRTPLERTKAFTALAATPKEAADYIATIDARIANMPVPPKPGEPPPKPDVGQSEWYDPNVKLMQIDGQDRTSIITDPADGRLPYNIIGLHAADDAGRRDEEEFDGPEDRAPDERCLSASGSALAPPMLPPVYNAHYQVVQTPTVFAIHAEMIHDVRLISMGERHAGAAPRWLGESSGRWDGDTLVVETLNQHPLSADRFVSGRVLHLTPATRVTERLTRISAKQLRYTFTVEDPSIFTRPWSGETVFTATDEPIYEYACHEGNYALANILRGARKKEADAADKAKPH